MHNWLRLSLLLLVIFNSQFSISILHAQTVGEAFYIYRNDGQFNAFFRDEVDSIAYSHYDADSIYYDENVTQLVYTADSLYRIPLAAIDSVSFVQPETIYQPNVISYPSLSDYIVSVNDMCISFKNDIPSSVAPKKGDVLYFETYEEPFPMGFAGKVSDVTIGDYYTVCCDTATIQDVYQQVVSCDAFGTLGDEDVSEARGGRRKASFSSKPITIPIGAGVQLPGAGGGVSGSITFTATGKIVKKFVVGEEPQFDASITFTEDMNMKTEIHGGINGSINLINKPLPPVPLGATGLYAEVLITPFLDYSLEDALSAELNRTVSTTYGCRLEKGRLMPYKVNSSPSATPNMSLSSNVSLFGGLMVEGSIALTGGIAKVKATGKVGVFADGNFVAMESGADNTNAYERNLNSQVTVGARMDISLTAGLYAELAGIEIAKAELQPVGFRMNFMEKNFYVVPTFTDMTYTKGSDLSEAVVSGRVSRNLIGAKTIGLSLYDSTNKLVDSYYAPQSYKKDGYDLSATFKGLKPGTQYICYPVVEVDKQYWKATPSVTVGSSFTVTTGEATNITMDAATLGGSFTGSDVEEYGVCYAKAGSDEWKRVKVDRAEGGVFTVDVEKLLPETGYSFYAYVKVHEEYINGEEKTFTTPRKPVISSVDATGITAYEVVVGGRIDGYAPDLVEKYGVMFEENGRNNWQNFEADNITDDGSFTVALSNLQPNTKYDFFAYMHLKGAKESDDGLITHFTTLEEGVVAAITGEATNVTKESAVLNGTIEGYDETRVKEYGFFYCEYGGTPVNIQASYISDGAFSAALSGLTLETTYTFYAYCIDDKGTTIEGERKTFSTMKKEEGVTTCPDGNHPHMIDLGLPSGTKWACCNVGASEPEQYGNYYAWGETQPKSTYNWETYAYWHDNDGNGSCNLIEIVNIGSDIAGTGYDAATVNWGAPWRMPSWAQCQELNNKCPYTWTTQNGVYGRKFFGPSGGTIFLPAAGYHYSDWGLYGAGSDVEFWSSTLDEDYQDEAYCLGFYSGFTSWGCGSARSNGLSVRPVR